MTRIKRLLIDATQSWIFPLQLQVARQLCCLWVPSVVFVRHSQFGQVLYKSMQFAQRSAALQVFMQSLKRFGINQNGDTFVSESTHLTFFEWHECWQLEHGLPFLYGVPSCSILLPLQERKDLTSCEKVEAIFDNGNDLAMHAEPIKAEFASNFQ